MPEINEVIDGLQKDFKAFRETHTAELKAIANDRGTAELAEKLAKITASMDTLQKAADTFAAEKKALNDRIDRMEAERETLGKAGQDAKQAERQEHMEAFNAWLRTGQKAGPMAERLKTIEAKATKAANVSNTSAAGGYAIPEILFGQIFEQELLNSPVRNRITVVTASNTDFRVLVDKRGASSGWVAEAGSRAATLTPDLRERVPTFGTLYAYVSATEESLNDIGFDVASWLSRNIAYELARAEGAAVISGNGTNKPTGLLNTTPVTTNDGASPERAATTLEYFPLDVGTSPSVNIQAQYLFDLIYNLRAPYRNGAAFVANSATIGRLRRLRDTTGQFLWQPSLQAGQPASLAGYPVDTWEDLGDVAVNTYPILFGNFARGYILVDVQGMRITVDDNITAPGYCKWYVRKRVGGCVLDNYAVKVGKIAAA